MELDKNFPVEQFAQAREDAGGGSSSESALSKSSLTLSFLIEALEQKALPWMTTNPERVIIPRATYREMTVNAAFPPSVEIVPSPLRSRRVTVQGRPNGFLSISARWPEDRVETKRINMIGCTIRGQADLRISNYIMRCNEGNFILIASGIPHPDGTTPHFHDDSRHDRSCDILWFCPMRDVLKCWICRSENGKHSIMPSLFLKHPSLCAYFNAVFEELTDGSPLRAKIRQGLLIAMIASAQKDIQEGSYFRWLPGAVQDDPEEEADPIKRAQTYIRQHLADYLTLDSVARYCYMSRSQFARVFHSETGETFNHFVTQCRLEEAKLRLRTTNVQIAGIARHVGLKPRHFNELIRQHIGMTPGEYRRQHRDEGHSY